MKDPNPGERGCGWLILLPLLLLCPHLLIAFMNLVTGN